MKKSGIKVGDLVYIYERIYLNKPLKWKAVVTAMEDTFIETTHRRCRYKYPEFRSYLRAYEETKTRHFSLTNIETIDEANRKERFKSYHNEIAAVYWSMIDRCTNIYNRWYDKYGGRGIIVCERWLRGFEYFYADMGSRPTNRHTIERIDNNGGYNPLNCKWATYKEQSRNKSNTVKMMFKGELTPICDIAEITGISYDKIYKNYRDGMRMFEL